MSKKTRIAIIDKQEVEVTIQNGDMTEAQIAALKTEHGRIVEISVIEGLIEYLGYFKRPSMETISAVNKVAKVDELKASDVMLKNCWLGGDPNLKSDAILSLAATAQLATLMSSCVGSIKNL